MAGPKLEIGIETSQFISKLKEVNESLSEKFPYATKRSVAALKQFESQVEHISDPTTYLNTQIQNLTRSLNSGRIAPAQYHQEIAKLGDEMQNSSKFCSQFSEGLIMMRNQFLATTVSVFGFNQGLQLVQNSTRNFAELETGLVRVRTATQVTASEMHQVQDLALAIGRNKMTEFTSVQGLESLGKAGIGFKDQMSLINPVLDLAANEMGSLGEAADAIATLLSQFNLQAYECKALIDEMTQAANASAQKMPQLVYMLQDVAGVATAAGESQQEVILAATALAQKGFAGARGNEALRGFYIELEGLQKPTHEQSLLLAQLGLTTDDLNVKTKHFTEIIEALHDAQLNGAESAKLFGKVAGAKMMGIFNDGIVPLKKLEEGIKNSVF